MFKTRNRLTREFIKFNSLVDEATGCWNWAGHVQSSGYGQFRYRNKNLLAHRASYSIFKDIDHDEVFDINEINGILVCHKCDNTKCVNPDHLFLGNNKDNMADCMSKGRAYVQNGGSAFCFTKVKRVKKLTDQQVMEIYGSRESLRYLSEKYGVSMGNISFIRNGKRKQLVTQVQYPPTPQLATGEFSGLSVSAPVITVSVLSVGTREGTQGTFD